MAAALLRHESHTYRTVAGVPLEARLLLPPASAAGRPAAAWFHPVFGPALRRVDEFLTSLGHLEAVGDLDDRIAGLAALPRLPRPRQSRS